MRLEIIVRGDVRFYLDPYQREIASRGARDRKRCRRVTGNVCCVNDAETLWRNLGQHHGTKAINFFFPSLRIIVGISLLWSIESCSRRIDIVFSLSYSFCLIVNEKDRILLDERFDFFEKKKKKEFRIDRRLYFLIFLFPKSGRFLDRYELKRRFAIKAPFNFNKRTCT